MYHGENGSGGRKVKSQGEQVQGDSLLLSAGLARLLSNVTNIRALGLVLEGLQNKCVRPQESIQGCELYLSSFSTALGKRCMIY